MSTFLRETVNRPEEVNPVFVHAVSRTKRHVPHLSVTRIIIILCVTVVPLRNNGVVI